jgi:hypothetical protein
MYWPILLLDSSLVLATSKDEPAALPQVWPEVNRADAMLQAVKREEDDTKSNKIRQCIL